MNKLALTAVIAALAITGTSASAATKAAAKPAAKPAAAAAPAAGDSQAQHAMLYLKVLISGLQSDKVEEPVKGVLVGCIYDNPFSKVTESMDKVIAENPGKISRDNPSELLSVMAQICGYKPTAAGAAAPGAAKTPAPQGR